MLFLNALTYQVPMIVAKWLADRPTETFHIQCLSSDLEPFSLSGYLASFDNLSGWQFNKTEPNSLWPYLQMYFSTKHMFLSLNLEILECILLALPRTQNSLGSALYVCMYVRICVCVWIPSLLSINYADAYAHMHTYLIFKYET